MRGPEWSLDAESRWKSTLEAAQRLGLQCPAELQITLHATQLTTEIAFRTFTELLKQPPQFTAICSFNDSAAMGAIRAMADVGLSCPKDISVLGFDDIVTASYFLPRLTTVSQPLELMGMRATEWLISRIPAWRRDCTRQYRVAGGAAGPGIHRTGRSGQSRLVATDHL